MSLESPVKYDVNDQLSWVNQIGDWRSLGLNFLRYKQAAEYGQKMLDEMKNSGSPVFFLNSPFFWF